MKKTFKQWAKQDKDLDDFLSPGDNIIHTSISKIIIEISYTDDSFLMVYKLSDGLSVPRNNYPQWGKRLFRDKDSLMRYLSES